MIRHWRYYLPLAIFLILVLFLWRGLQLDPHKLPSSLLDKPIPEFRLPDLMAPGKLLSKQQFMGQVTLVNIWATWCTACQREHAVLLDIARSGKVKLYALDYKDDLQAAQNWLAQYGNPYQAIGFDKKGLIAIDWGVYGTPETFLVDKQGIIRYKHIGVLTKQVWQDKLLPLVERLQGTEP
jgi:cytochrome c biogenesis protein CcmG/thiol:disulfide interchange protein DsbE